MMLRSDIEKITRNIFARISNIESGELLTAVSLLLENSSGYHHSFSAEELRITLVTLTLGEIEELCHQFCDVRLKLSALEDISNIWETCSTASPVFAGRERETFDAVFFLCHTKDFGQIWDIGASSGVSEAIDTYFSGVPAADIIA